MTKIIGTYIKPTVQKNLKNPEAKYMIWYLHLEGRCKGNDEITEPFGFFVHALVDSHTNEEAKLRVANQLADEDMCVTNFRSCGEFTDFDWDNQELKLKLEELGEQAKVSGEPVFSEFQSWLMPSLRKE